MFETRNDSGAGALLSRLRADTAILVEEVAESRGWAPPERSSALESLDLILAAVSRARAHLLVAERDAGTTQRPGDRSFEAARARVSRSSTAEATRQVRQAEALVSMSTVAAAVTDGRFPLGHLDTLARVAATASPQVASVLRSADAQATVVQMASTQSAPDFATSLTRFAASQDPAALEASHQDARRDRFLTLSHQPRGTYLKGFLDRVSGEVLQNALDAAGQVPGDDRSPGQAAADALVVVAHRACAGLTAPSRTAPGRSGAGRQASAPASAAGAGAGEAGGRGESVTGGGSSARPHLSLIVPAETFAELRTHFRGREGTDRSTQWSPVAPATLEDGTPVPMSVLAQALCDCELTRIVVSAEGVPLDLGRTRRTYTGAQRRAVIARDQHCAWNGCATPARWSEVHHIRWWDRDGGVTSVDNGVLLCDFHHHQVHALDLTIQRHVKPPGHARRQRALGRRVEPGPARYTFWTRDKRPYNSPPRE